MLCTYHPAVAPDDVTLFACYLNNSDYKVIVKLNLYVICPGPIMSNLIVSNPPG